MKDIVIYFKSLEKIFEVNFHDIHYSLKKKQILTQLFATQWFVTSFNSDTEEFEEWISLKPSNKLKAGLSKSPSNLSPLFQNIFFLEVSYKLL